MAGSSPATTLIRFRTTERQLLFPDKGPRRIQLEFQRNLPAIIASVSQSIYLFIQLENGKIPVEPTGLFSQDSLQLGLGVLIFVGFLVVLFGRIRATSLRHDESETDEIETS